MPTWDKILDELNDAGPVEAKIFEKYITRLSKYTNRTTICYMSAFSIIRKWRIPVPYHGIIDQDIQGFMTCSNNVDRNVLDLVLHSPGGDFEATKRIINYLHETYKHIRVFIPHMAMSGGTLMACAADEIYMGPYSSLGPTDPQILLEDKYVPVGAIIKEFEQAFEEVSADPRKALLWNERLGKVPFGIRQAVETIQVNSVKYLKELLKKRNCREKSEHQIDEIAKVLCSHEGYSSHGQGICLTDVKDKLYVNDLRRDKKLENLVLSVYHSAIIMFERIKNLQKIIINNKNRRYIVQYSPN